MDRTSSQHLATHKNNKNNINNNMKEIVKNNTNMLMNTYNNNKKIKMMMHKWTMKQTRSKMQMKERTRMIKMMKINKIRETMILTTLIKTKNNSFLAKQLTKMEKIMNN